ncbi:hypothetical protein A0U92_07160 [Acetobacter aceti]|uniref:Transposase IS4-like domain-containing protein n=1 Tax=Acetobacter aceti TaxID=435 RepID=A0A1U9KFK6_ACEAC|nr:hypothetical protein A0U92_07160 [Acetobacter aceti]
MPLTVLLFDAYVHDSRMLEPLLDAIPAIRGQRGRLKHRPAKLHADKGHEYRRRRTACTRIACALICFKALNSWF